MVAMGDRYYISNSELSTWRRCRRKWWLQYYRKLQPKLTDYAGIRRSGSRVHDVLAVWYSGNRTVSFDPMHCLNEIIETDRSALMQNMSVVWADEALQNSRLKEFNDAVAYERAMIEGYIQWLSETGVDSEFDVISSEQELVVPFERMSILDRVFDVYSVGIVDVQVRRNTDGAIAFLDHKTVQSLTQPLPTLNQNTQMLHYMWLQHRIGDPVYGVYYNMLRRVKRTATAKPPFFDRTFISHSAHEIEAYEDHLCGTVYDILTAVATLDRIAERTPGNSAHHLSAYPSPRSECSWDCDFFSVCPLFDDGSHAEAMLSARYEVHNPLDRYKSITSSTSDTLPVELLSDADADSEDEE